jgi:hypothetical protein
MVFYTRFYRDETATLMSHARRANTIHTTASTRVGEREQIEWAATSSITGAPPKPRQQHPYGPAGAGETTDRDSAQHKQA